MYRCLFIVVFGIGAVGCHLSHVEAKRSREPLKISLSETIKAVRIADKNVSLIDSKTDSFGTISRFQVGNDTKLYLYGRPDRLNEIVVSGPDADLTTINVIGILAATLTEEESHRAERSHWLTTAVVDSEKYGDGTIIGKVFHGVAIRIGRSGGLLDAGFCSPEKPVRQSSLLPLVAAVGCALTIGVFAGFAFARQTSKKRKQKDNAAPKDL